MVAWRICMWSGSRVFRVGVYLPQGVRCGAGKGYVDASTVDAKTAAQISDVCTPFLKAHKILCSIHPWESDVAVNPSRNASSTRTLKTS